MQEAGTVNDSVMLTARLPTVPFAPTPIPLAANPRQIRHSRPVPATLAPTTCSPSERTLNQLAERKYRNRHDAGEGLESDGYRAKTFNL